MALSDHGNEQDLFERVFAKVNADPLRGLLVEYAEKHPGEIRTSGAKADLVDHLKAAVDAGRVPRERVFALLQEGEENGGQTILYYVPKSKAVRERYSRPEEVAATLFGADWERTQQFPRLPRLTNTYQVVDFRVGYMGKPQDWLMKVYSFQEREVLVRQLQPGDVTYRGLGLKESEFAVIYDRQVVESVCLARWNSDENRPLLEVRVEQSGRLPRLKVDVNAIWTRLRPAFNHEEDFDPWELRSPLERMLRDWEANTGLYRLGLTNLVDSGEGGVRFTPYTEQDSLDATPIRMQTIHQILDDGGRCDRLVITWLTEQSGGALAKQLRTYAGSRGTNELVIGSQTSGRAVDYVTDQLRRFAG